MSNRFDGYKVVGSQRLDLGEVLSTPSYRYQERLLGYETDLVCIGGIPANRVNMVKVSNTRKTDKYIDKMIEEGWTEEKRRYPNAEDKPRARYEEGFFDIDKGRLHIMWSDDRYKNHAALRHTILPKPYQANLFTINGVPLTENHKIPIAVRNPEATDQGRIRHIVPAGFVDVREIDKELRSEDVSEATIRKLFDELDYSPSLPESPYAAAGRELFEELRYGGVEEGFPPGVFNPEDMRILGIVYNHSKNFDYTATVLIPLKAKPEDIKLEGKEHEALEWVDTEDIFTLKGVLFRLAVAPETNSGHLRGDVALTIGHVHGEKAYNSVLEEVTLKLAGYQDE
jgi:ADP-ribose pyrophosphatase YjhB (NUDIX family)